MTVEIGRRGMRITLACVLLLPFEVPAADVGGWYADRQKAEAQAGSAPPASACPQVVARATEDGTALGAYHAALCYLQADTPDLVAAKAWLSQSADMQFLPAHRMLRALRLAEAGVHSPVPHCHDLGEGRQVCHGGASGQPVAAMPVK